MGRTTKGAIRLHLAPWDCKGNLFFLHDTSVEQRVGPMPEAVATGKTEVSGIREKASLALKNFISYL